MRERSLAVSQQAVVLQKKLGERHIGVGAGGSITLDPIRVAAGETVPAEARMCQVEIAHWNPHQPSNAVQPKELPPVFIVAKSSFHAELDAIMKRGIALMPQGAEFHWVLISIVNAKLSVTATKTTITIDDDTIIQPKSVVFHQNYKVETIPMPPEDTCARLPEDAPTQRCEPISIETARRGQVVLA
ncbi:MAG: hypothetical protein PHS53_02075 [Candidatus Pacebacteria bacterium]|nr:hypothetical protein [Candidatus Paceibacterota bacterium]MDD5356912.1 hypothetical protein [Candidatus Paceibacterota bacterium]